MVSGLQEERGGINAWLHSKIRNTFLAPGARVGVASGLQEARVRIGSRLQETRVRQWRGFMSQESDLSPFSRC
jgi:hypothetical protein